LVFPAYAYMEGTNIWHVAMDARVQASKICWVIVISQRNDVSRMKVHDAEGDRTYRRNTVNREVLSGYDDASIDLVVVVVHGRKRGGMNEWIE